MEFESIILSHPLVWSTPLGLPRECGICMHQHWTSGKRRRRRRRWHSTLTHGAMRGCGLTSLVVCINEKKRDMRERNVTIRSEIWTTNIRSLGFRVIREWVILWGLILRSLGCNLGIMKVMSTWLVVILTGYCHIGYRRGRVTTQVWARRPGSEGGRGRGGLQPNEDVI